MFRIRREKENLSRRAKNDEKCEIKSESWGIRECRGLFQEM